MRRGDCRSLRVRPVQVWYLETDPEGRLDSKEDIAVAGGQTPQSQPKGLDLDRLVDVGRANCLMAHLRPDSASTHCPAEGT
jgi:hypothetical protein